MEEGRNHTACLFKVAENFRVNLDENESTICCLILAY